MTTKHPAKYSKEIINTISREIPLGALCFDPFAGIGKIFDEIEWADWVGMEIEQEWADQHPLILCGDVFEDIPDWWEEFFDIVCTSCSYGNRLADHHNPKDGSTRHGYKFYLGRDLSPNNSAGIQWGDYYQAWHAGAWLAVLFTLRKGGKLILNVSNHIRGFEEQHVWEWHVQFLLDQGLRLQRIYPINTRRLREGKNYQARVNCEYVFVFEK